MDIISKAKELGTLIGNSQEMKRLNKSEEAVENDTKAQTLLDDYKQMQIELIKASKENGESEVVASIKEKLLSTHHEINDYPITKEYLEAKATLDNMMKTINDVIIFAITGEEPCSHSGCGSCGGGCK